MSTRRKFGVHSEPNSVFVEETYSQMSTTATTNSSSSGSSSVTSHQYGTDGHPERQCTVTPKKFPQKNSLTDFHRTESAHSLPVNGSNTPTMSLYEKTLHSLANDVSFQKEVALGKRIGFYRLGKELGCGNFSKVRLGVHILTKEKVAVKVMEKSKMDQKAQRLLAREIHSMEQTHHPNIIRLFECVETLSKTYLIMEYAGGGELYNYVHENGKLSEPIAKSLFAQILSAISHLHSKGLVHRDLKSENIIFAQQGWVKVADFGFSSACPDGCCLSTFCGSPPYAAPELFKDEDYRGQLVDIWALGVLLYFMLVGVTPFRGETVQELKKSILNGGFTIPDYISHEAQYVIRRTLESEISKRITTLELVNIEWIKDTRLTEEYPQFSMTPDEKELETNETERKVWNTLNEYGITMDMIRDSVGKGARNPIIGTYRIVLYQNQAVDLDKERIKVNGHLIELAERNRLIQQKLQKHSKTCALI